MLSQTYGCGENAQHVAARHVGSCDQAGRSTTVPAALGACHTSWQLVQHCQQHAARCTTAKCFRLPRPTCVTCATAAQSSGSRLHPPPPCPPPAEWGLLAAGRQQIGTTAAHNWCCHVQPACQRRMLPALQVAVHQVHDVQHHLCASWVSCASAAHRLCCQEARRPGAVHRWPAPDGVAGWGIRRQHPGTLIHARWPSPLAPPPLVVAALHHALERARQQLHSCRTPLAQRDWAHAVAPCPTEQSCEQLPRSLCRCWMWTV